MKERMEQIKKQMVREAIVIGVGALAYVIIKDHQRINELTEVIRKQNETLDMMKLAIDHNTDQAYKATEYAMTGLCTMSRIINKK